MNPTPKKGDHVTIKGIAFVVTSVTIHKIMGLTVTLTAALNETSPA